jgi:hypothetical protein
LFPDHADNAEARYPVQFPAKDQDIRSKTSQTPPGRPSDSAEAAVDTRTFPEAMRESSECDCEYECVERAPPPAAVDLAFAFAFDLCQYPPKHRIDQ